MKNILCSILVISVLSSASCKTTKQVEPSSYSTNPHVVLDWAGVLDTTQEASLNSMLKVYEAKTTKEILIVTKVSIPTEESIQKHAMDIGNSFGVGKAELDNGLVILLSVGDRKVFLAAGTGTAKDLSDATCQTIIDEAMLPQFKNLKYYQGIYDGLLRIMEEWE